MDTRDIIAYLLSDKATEEDFSRYLPQLDGPDLQMMYSRLTVMMENQESDNWHLNRDVRAVDNRIAAQRFDFDRIKRAMENISHRLSQTFQTVFRDPVGAQRNCWSHEQKYGIERTVKIFRSSPTTFGELRGTNISVFWMGERFKAKKTAQNTDYLALRRFYDAGARKLHTIKHYVQGGNNNE